jgi:transposase
MNSILPQSISKKKIYVGIDVHNKSYAVCVIEDGGIFKHWSGPASPAELVATLRRRYPSVEINTVYEAGFSGFVLHRALAESGINNIVVHPCAVAVSSHDQVKTDKRDAKKLAMHLAANMLTGIRIPTIKEEIERQLPRLRDQLVDARVRVMNQVRRRLGHFGYVSINQGVLQIKAVRKVIESMPQHALSESLSISVAQWEMLNDRVKAVEALLRRQAENCPLEKTYRTVPGIGKVSARLLATELGDMSQFRNEKTLFRFFGLTPREDSSGERIRRGGISKQGNARIRKILVEAAWVAIRQDTSLREFYSKISARRGSPKAIVATARKLIGRIRAVLKKKEEYQCETDVVAQQAA